MSKFIANHNRNKKSPVSIYCLSTSKPVLMDSKRWNILYKPTKFSDNLALIIQAEMD